MWHPRIPELGGFHDVRTRMIIRAVITASVALLAACAAQQPAPASTAPQIAASGTQETPQTVSSAPAESTPKAAPKPEPKAKPTPAAKPETKPEPKPKTKPAPSTVAKQSAQPQPKAPSTARVPAPAAAKPPAPAPLDLTSLEERLKETEAIGHLTKL